MVIFRRSWFLALLAFSLAACSITGEPVFSPVQPATATPFQPLPTADPTANALPTATTEPLTIGFDPAVPETLKVSVSQASKIPLAVQGAKPAVSLELVQPNQPGVEWIYALVTPFSSRVDAVSFADLRACWSGDCQGPFSGRPLLMSPETRTAFVAAWGEPESGTVQEIPAAQILDSAWSQQPSWAIVPFEELQPRWKVLRLDNLSPLDKGLDLAAYPLKVRFGWSSAPEGALLPMLTSNRDENQMTRLVMTGVTALVRATAFKMEQNGMTYPANDIGEWLRNADVTHISNEVTFYTDCPYPNMADPIMQFCSDPRYIELLDAVGADVIELTGNHNNDVRTRFGADVYAATLDMYRQRGWAFFGGGENLEQSMQPAIWESNGHRFAFIGCNSLGPNYAWATENSSGAASCGDLQWMEDEVRRLSAEGYLVVVTFQHSEDYSRIASPQQREDFRRMIDAGAVIVQGSQAHTPKEMEFYNGGFIHYGLGNLFFDQMGLGEDLDSIPSSEAEFIDRHVFYAGQYINTELLTARLEDFAKPRPMFDWERTRFLQTIFSVSGW